MPMLKTVSVGRTSITNVQSYLEGQQRQNWEVYQKEWQSYEQGDVQLSARQVGHLKDYLGEQSRGLATDVSDGLSARFWARDMDMIRWTHEKSIQLAEGKRSRGYYHYVLSPDPKDDCTLSTLRAYAQEWAEENFRTKERTYEYAIVYHDDNANGILHAHIVVSATDSRSGKKLQLDNDQVAELELSAQIIGKRYGLTPIREDMQTSIGARTTQPVYLDRKEREILNKGGYSWKWELRQFISSIAPLSADFDDFKWKLNRAGYDVVCSEKTGYLTYTHRNGMKVKDSRLGARFYLDALERVFNRESVLSDKAYSSWELIKISKGEVPWKEDIRRAIDAVAPTVVSIAELQRELKDRYGIRLIINRRGITYQHASGFKTRDVSIGFRYTFEGLEQNAVVGMPLPYPGYADILRESETLVTHYLPRSRQVASRWDPEQAASHFVYRDLSEMMVRYGIVRMEDLQHVLEDRYRDLKEEKAGIVQLRNQVMRWNHLAVLQSRFDKDGDFLQNERESADPAVYNDTLLRYERIGLYLKEQTNGESVQENKEAFSKAYEERLGSYQHQLNELNRDLTIYQNYLMAKEVRSFSAEEGEGGIDVQALFAAGRTLSNHHIRDFFHLEQVLLSQESNLDLHRLKLKRVTERKKKLEGIQDDIRSYIETKPYQPVSHALEGQPWTLDVESQMMRYKEATKRLAALGLTEADFPEQQQIYRAVVQEHSDLLREDEQIQAAIDELREAKTVCLAIGETVKIQAERNDVDWKKSSGSDESRSVYTDGDTYEHVDKDAHANNTKLVVEDLPFEEARKRRQERMLHRPERSKRYREDLER